MCLWISKFDYERPNRPAFRALGVRGPARPGCLCGRESRCLAGAS